MSRSLLRASWRHRAAAFAGVATLAAAGATGVTTAASAAPSSTGQLHSERVCPRPAPGYAACNAWVRTDGHGNPHQTATPVAYDATALQSAYNVRGLAPSPGTTVAIVDAYANPNAARDLAVYRDTMGLPALTGGQFTEVSQSGDAISTVSADVGWGQEEMLDLEMVSAICPACSILYVGANSATFDDLATAVNFAATRAGVVAISNSYGGGEFPGETAYDGAYHHPGIAITVSAGDSGYGVEYPAASQYVTAVGGTSLTLTSKDVWKSETVWSGTGSGCSAYEPKPSWQHDGATCPNRTVADVAAVADPNTGVSVYDSYGSTGDGWYVFGGTSVASPIIASIYALSGDTSGVPATLAYNAPAGSLHDVTSGSNGHCSNRHTPDLAYLCTGVGGYDGPTGNGTPNGTGAF